MITAERYHDISCGHRVYGHESKCAHLHGHNYRIHFKVEAHGENELDSIGRVLDFSVIKSALCMWIEEYWDHKFLVWIEDPIIDDLGILDPNGVVACEFNPTAENMAMHLLDVVAPVALAGTGCRLLEVRIEETRKCSATYKVK